MLVNWDADVLEDGKRSHVEDRGWRRRGRCDWFLRGMPRCRQRYTTSSTVQHSSYKLCDMSCWATHESHSIINVFSDQITLTYIGKTRSAHGNTIGLGRAIFCPRALINTHQTDGSSVCVGARTHRLEWRLWLGQRRLIGGRCRCGQTLCATGKKCGSYEYSLKDWFK